MENVVIQIINNQKRSVIMAKPNIIMLISHDTGRYLGCYGKEVATPALDKMAKDGVRFENYFCTQPQCSPSRGSILTGLYAHNHGMMGLGHMGFSMHEEVTTIPMEMQKNGYDTYLYGFNHERINGQEDAHLLGYKHVEKVEGNLAEKVTDKFIDLLQEKSSGSETPFYASVGFEETHRDFDHYEPDPLDDIEVPPYLPDTPEVRRDLAHFQGSVKALDKAVERIVTTLQETGLAENTLLIYTTDHGIAFPRAKGTLFEAGLETALIMHWPKRYSGGKVYNNLLCNVDLMPTLLELIEAEVPKEIDGKSFLSLIEEKPYEEREEFYCELTWHDRYHPMRGIRTNEFKYIRNFKEGVATYLPLDIHQSLSGQVVREDYYGENVPEELYDLRNDPLEQNNLASNDKYHATLLQLREKVNTCMLETNDPLLKGDVLGEEAPGWKDEVMEGNVPR
jgi:N-sulfoglucosamine sulfohydrolase